MKNFFRHSLDFEGTRSHFLRNFGGFGHFIKNECAFEVIFSNPICSNLSSSFILFQYNKIGWLYDKCLIRWGANSITLHLRIMTNMLRCHCSLDKSCQSADECIEKYYLLCCCVIPVCSLLKQSSESYLFFYIIFPKISIEITSKIYR